MSKVATEEEIVERLEPDESDSEALAKLKNVLSAHSKDLKSIKASITTLTRLVAAADQEKAEVSLARYSRALKVLRERAVSDHTKLIVATETRHLVARATDGAAKREEFTAALFWCLDNCPDEWWNRRSKLTLDDWVGEITERANAPLSVAS